MEYKDREKNDAQKQHSEAVEQFESVATQLYEVLKQKEELIESQALKLQQGLPIAQIQQNEEILAHLQKEINALQWQTQRARKIMSDKEKLSITKSVDHKKYEKMKEIQYNQYVEDEKREELKFLDEISVQQFVRR
ncbi:flagellar export protein FliJ [Salisediminibacterium beveridgei]|nr:flagellar export protein FliJ [Salisediminibacterium beveridgei]